MCNRNKEGSSCLLKWKNIRSKISFG